MIIYLFMRIELIWFSFGSMIGLSTCMNSLPSPWRIAYQGEPGAYSEKASRELLGPRVMTVNYPSFEDVFKAVASRDADYAVVPIENSLGGSIHANFDLLLRYDLHIIAEHEFRVEHFLLALPGVKREDIKKVMSHPQALAQCENYLRDLGYIPTPTYDTAGSAKIIKEQNLLDCAAIASDLAGKTYGLDVLESNIEDHDNNFTRFLLLSRTPESSLIPPQMAVKTHLAIAALEGKADLYRIIDCFKIHDIRICRLEARPMAVDLLNLLKSSTMQSVAMGEGDASSPQSYSARFPSMYHIEIDQPLHDDSTQMLINALQTQVKYVRVIGSYPPNSVLVGPIITSATAPLTSSSSSSSVVADQLIHARSSTVVE